MLMADRRIGPWLTCTSWLIDHPRKTILVDTGEAPDFGSASYFAGTSAMLRRVYPRLIDCRVPKPQTLLRLLAAAGKNREDIDQCVLTHLHSDHVANLGLLPRKTRVVPAEEETRHSVGSGRLLQKLPADQGRLHFVEGNRDEPVFGTSHALTERRDVRVVRTPGHTIGHSSVLIDVGDRQVLLAEVGVH